MNNESDEKNKEKGSQQTRQSKKTRGANGPGKWRNKTNLTGDIAELGNNVYVYGSGDPGGAYIRTTDAIAEYVGREYNKAMRNLVKHQIESVPKEPDEPKEKDVSMVRMKKYDKDLSRYYTKLDEFEECKAKVFLIIKGQCTLTMKNKIESMTDYDDIEKHDDVIRLLNGLKELAFTTVKVQYEYWTVCQSMRKVLTMKQQDEESLAGFYKRFINTVDVTESQWGTVVPTKIGNDKTTRNKFLACVFLAGVERKRYGKTISELNNAFLAGTNNYPTTVEGTVTMLSHYMSEPPSVYRSGRNEEGRDRATSFAQRMQNVKCYKCQKKGHYANKCPELDSDNEPEEVSTIGSTRSGKSGKTMWSD